MVSFLRIERLISRTAERVNWVAAGAVAFIMLLTTLDVVLRAFFNHPIPGTYEIVSLTSAMVIAFSLPYTTVKRGHIAVEFLVQRLPRRARVAVNIVNALLGLTLFALLAWQSTLYAVGLRRSGEVSATLQMPTYPFVCGVALGCCLLCVVLLAEAFSQLKGAEPE